MNKFFLTITISIAILTARAQAPTDSIYIVGLKNGQVLKAKTVDEKHPFLGTAHLTIDANKKIDLKDVKYFSCPDGYFQKGYLNGSSNETLFKRESTGKIMLFSKTVTTTTYNGYAGGYGGGYAGGYSSTTSKLNFMQKNNGEITRLNYRNLYDALSDDPESLVILKQANTYRTATIVTFVGGVGVLIAGMASTFQSVDVSHPGPAPTAGGSSGGSAHFSPLVLVGAGIMYASNFFVGPKLKVFRNAIISYNMH